MRLMMRWAQLREAWSLLSRQAFYGDDQEIRRVRDLVSGEMRGLVTTLPWTGGGLNT